MNATAWLNNGETYSLRGKTQKKRQSYRHDFFRRGGYVLNSRRKPLPRAPAAIGVDVTDIISGCMARFQYHNNHNSHFQQLEDDDESHTVERVREKKRWLSVKLNAFANKYESRVNHTTDDTATHTHTKTSQNGIKMKCDSVFWALSFATTPSPSDQWTDLICLVLLSSKNKQNHMHESMRNEKKKRKKMKMMWNRRQSEAHSMQRIKSSCMKLNCDLGGCGRAKSLSVCLCVAT